MPGAERGQVPVPDRPDHPGARPRAGRAGVARQRQADPGVPRRRRPAGRRALLLLRRLGRQARPRRLRRRPAAARRGRPGHPVELPAADAGLEDRAGAGLRQHRGAQAGRDHAADRAAVRRDLPAGRPAAGRGQHRHRRRRRPAGALVEHPDVDKVAFTGSTEVGQAIAQYGRRHRARRSPSSSAARPPTSSSTTPRSTRPSRASSTASSSTRATSAAPARGCWCRSPSPTRCSTALKRRMAHAAGRRPAGQEHRHRRDQLRRAAGPDPRARPTVGEAEGAERWSPPCELPDRGLLVRRRRSSPASPRRTGSPARRSSARCCRC